MIWRMINRLSNRRGTKMLAGALAATGVFCLSTSALDNDSDGMSDIWQDLYNIATGDTTGNPDSDGFNNLSESIGATNPNSSGSKPDLTSESIFWDGFEDWWVDLSWYGVKGVRYQAQLLTSYFGPMNWYNVGSQVTGNNATMWFSGTYYDPWQYDDFISGRIIVTEAIDGDGDNLNAWEEFQLGTQDNDTDSDNDGLPDGWEASYSCLDPDSSAGNYGATGDPDSDTLTNATEYSGSTDPCVADIVDTDGDGLTDTEETGTYGTNPNTPFTDGDTLNDYDEVMVHNTNPNVEDSDGDGLWDGAEVNPTPPDPATDPNDADTDDDGMPDGWELGHANLNPTSATDKTSDPDGDALLNIQEYLCGTDPNLSDTDGDLTPDIVEAVGTATFEIWEGISGNPITNLTSDPNYPDSPTRRQYRTALDGDVSWAGSYGTRVQGYLRPSVTGYHTLWLASDDYGELRLSTDQRNSETSLIAWVIGWTGYQQWDKFATQESGSIFLVAGERYYFEILQKEGGGGDNVTVAWREPGGSLEVITGNSICPYNDADQDGLPDDWEIMNFGDLNQTV